ncbi:MAG: hypothetical protein OXC00_09485 [Acidimicrobiaceae bacterium]|nr:hypothetical protein [Acidimicrobiaceae bacterium]
MAAAKKRQGTRSLAPLLVTAADGLPMSAAECIRGNNVEHVQIIGGADAVSAAVAGQRRVETDAKYSR